MSRDNVVYSKTLTEALNDLASLYADRKVFGKEAAVKEADSGWLTSLGNTVATDPVARNALVGTAVGALGGAGSSLMEPNKKKRNTLSRALFGGLAGGAVGAGTGMLSPTAGGSGGSGAPEGTSPRINPKALANNPKLLDDIKRLSSSTNSLDDAIYSGLRNTGSFLWNTVPVSTVALPAYAANQLYQNTRWLPAGIHSMFGGKPGSRARGVFDLNRAEDVQNLHRKVDSRVLRSGLSKLLDSKASPEYAQQRQLIEKILARSDSDAILTAAQKNPNFTSVSQLTKQLFKGHKGPLSPVQQAQLQKEFANIATRAGVADVSSKSFAQLQQELLKLEASKVGLSPEQAKLFRGGVLTDSVKPDLAPLVKELGSIRRQLEKNPTDPALLKNLETLTAEAKRRTRVRLHGNLLDNAAVAGLTGMTSNHPDFKDSAPMASTKTWSGKVRMVPRGLASVGRHLPMLALPAAEYIGWSALQGMKNERTLQQRLQELTRSQGG